MYSFYILLRHRSGFMCEEGTFHRSSCPALHKQEKWRQWSVEGWPRFTLPFIVYANCYRQHGILHVSLQRLATAAPATVAKQLCQALSHIQPCTPCGVWATGLHKQEAGGLWGLEREPRGRKHSHKYTLNVYSIYNSGNADVQAFKHSWSIAAHLCTC